MERLTLQKHTNIKISEVRAFFGNTDNKLINAIASDLCMGKWEELPYISGIIILGKKDDPWEITFAAEDKLFLITKDCILALFSKDTKH